ncbi:hypothetical protein SAMN04488109_5987 [Chryseolinea serpens]|uniref:Uncharacterized protein n=1 Tax=Chryseolinea serpens TaxID=947013 RepID=A0A1M5WTA1_9BACT|nr:hypothetical protein [Chryseolinea serpens]SHH90652.1 hypothetical protein SAMN04488109_5987 [Chryseolinea serpens]
MTTANIAHFIKSGTFGGVRLGMTEAEVIGCLGTPDWRSDSKGEAFMFSYGQWEIHFLTKNSGKAFLIHNDHLLYDCINHDEMLQFQNSTFKIDLDFIKPFAHVRLKEVITWLKREKVPFSFQDKDYEPLLKLESGVYLDFTDTEPISTKDSGFHWGPGRQQDLQENETRIENSGNLILYAIGISNLQEVLSNEL